MSVIANPPFPSYFDTDGTPLENGYLYFGASGQNPETNPIVVYWDSAYTQPAAQPIRTSGGFAWRDGSPANVYVSTDFSMTVRDKNKRLVYSKLVSDAQTSGSVNLQFSRQSITATASQTVFSLSTSYTPGNNSLAVYRNGVLLTIVTDYTETSSTIVTLISGATAGQVFTFVIANPINPSSLGAAAVAYLPAGAGAIATDVQTALRRFTSAKDFGVIGNGIADDTAAIQNAVTAVCGAGGHLRLPAGSYKISAPITLPNTSFKISGEGPTATAISETSGNIRLFDFSSCNGPLKVVENIAFNGPTPGTASGTGIYGASSNGLMIRGCWFAGLINGIDKPNTSSFINLLDCVFEYNTTGINFADGVECIVSNTTFYRNTTDFYASGDLETFVMATSSHIETVSYGIRLVGASRGRFANITARKDAGTATPDIVRLEGASQYNNFDGVTSKAFGRVLVAMASGATAKYNRLMNLRATGPISAGVEIGSGNTDNVFLNYFLDGQVNSIVEAAGNNIYRSGTVNNATSAGILLSSADNCEFAGLTMAGNSVDWQTSGSVSTVWLDDVDTTMVGLTPTRFGSRRAGIYGRTFYGTAVPGSLAYLKGDRVVNVNPSVGSPKAWICTVAGTPGTWVSEGNL